MRAVRLRKYVTPARPDLLLLDWERGACHCVRPRPAGPDATWVVRVRMQVVARVSVPGSCARKLEALAVGGFDDPSAGGAEQFQRVDMEDTG